jgi:hypothetical protein
VNRASRRRSKSTIRRIQGAVTGSNGSTTTDSSRTPMASHDAMAVNRPLAR